MKKIIILFLINLSFFVYAENFINLESEKEINSALEEIKLFDSTQYQALVNLKQSNSKDFKSRLYNYYYILKYNEKAIKALPKRHLGYRELVKISSKKLSDLNIKYKNSKSLDEKSQIESEIKAEALNRFQIELFRHVLQIVFMEQELNNSKEKLKDFEKNETKFVDGIITKTKSM